MSWKQEYPHGANGVSRVRVGWGSLQAVEANAPGIDPEAIHGL